MKLSGATLILVLMALGLGGFVYFWEIQNTTQRQEAKEKQPQIFAFAENDVESLTIKNKNLTLNLQRNPQSTNPKWLLKSPVSEPANDAIVSYLMNLLVKGKSDRTISTPPQNIAEFGLDQPSASIYITLKNQKNYQLILGKSDFSGRFVYAQTDTTTQPNGNVNVLLVSTDFTNAVNRQLSEWQQGQKVIPDIPQTIPEDPS